VEGQLRGPAQSQDTAARACRGPRPDRQPPARRSGLRVVVGGGFALLPIGRIVGLTDIAALPVHLMTNTAIPGATFDIDGGQQLVQG
jgi:hypothetical protein